MSYKLGRPKAEGRTYTLGTSSAYGFETLNDSLGVDSRSDIGKVWCGCKDDYGLYKDMWSYLDT